MHALRLKNRSRNSKRIVDQLEKGDLALEESLKLFEEGVGLSAACKQELDAAEGKVQTLVKQRDGSLKAEPFLTEKPLHLQSHRTSSCSPIPCPSWLSDSA